MIIRERTMSANFASSGKWTEEIQIPKDSCVLNADDSIKWSEVPNGGYVLGENGDAIKDSFVPRVGEIIDRYGPMVDIHHQFLMENLIITIKDHYHI